MKAVTMAAVLGGLISTQVLAGGIQVEESITLKAKPAAVWALVGNFNGLHRWHPAVVGSSLTASDVRVLTLGNGATITETQLSEDNEQLSYSYRIDASPLPVAGYESMIKLSAEGDNTVVTWSSSFDAAGATDQEAADVIRGIYKAGLNQLSAFYN